MTLDEAALEMDGRSEGVLVFRDAVTERVSVLYRRKDGHLGLIEPEP
jgi:putative sigma-54 modulation protein